MHTPPAPGRPRRAFTMVEILIVISVIIILASIGMFVGRRLSDSAKERNTKAAFAALTAAMSHFLKDHPEPNDLNWVAVLRSDPDGARAIGKLKTSGSGATLVVLDGYGNPIHFIPSKTLGNLPTARFHSYGPNGITGAPNTAASKDDLYSEDVAPQ